MRRPLSLPVSHSLWRSCSLSGRTGRLSAARACQSAARSSSPVLRRQSSGRCAEAHDGRAAGGGGCTPRRRRRYHGNRPLTFQVPTCCCCCWCQVGTRHSPRQNAHSMPPVHSRSGAAPGPGLPAARHWPASRHQPQTAHLMDPVPAHPIHPIHHPSPMRCAAHCTLPAPGSYLLRNLHPVLTCWGWCWWWRTLACEDAPPPRRPPPPPPDAMLREEEELPTLG